MTKKEMIIEVLDYNYVTPKEYEDGIKCGMKLSKNRVEELYQAFIEDKEHVNFYRYLLTRI